MDGNPTERFQDHFHVARGRHDRGVLDPMIREEGKGPVREARLEEKMIARHPVPCERSVCVLVALVVELVVGELVRGLFLVARMSGQQMSDGFRSGVLGGEVQGHAGAEERAQALEEGEAGVCVFHQARNGDRRRGPVLKALSDYGLQRAMRSHFQDHIGPMFPLDDFHRCGKTHGLADVRPPVGAVEALDVRAGHRGDERDLDIEAASVKKGERRPRVVLEGIHRPGMKGDVSRNQAVLQISPLRFRDDGSQVVRGTANDGIGRRVLAGDFDPRRSGSIRSEGSVQGFKNLLYPGSIQADCQHATGSGPALLQRRAMEDQPRCIAKGERPAGVGCGDLAGAVANHAVGVYPPGLEQLHERALEHEDDRLSELALVERGLGGGKTGLAQ